MLDKIKTFTLEVIAEGKIRFSNLRTVEGGVLIANGLVLYFAVTVAAFVGIDIVALAQYTGLGFILFGGFKFLTK